MAIDNTVQVLVDSNAVSVSRRGRVFKVYSLPLLSGLPDGAGVRVRNGFIDVPCQEGGVYSIDGRTGECSYHENPLEISAQDGSVAVDGHVVVVLGGLPVVTYSLLALSGRPGSVVTQRPSFVGVPCPEGGEFQILRETGHCVYEPLPS